MRGLRYLLAALLVLTSADVATRQTSCENDGILSDGVCNCPGFTSGDRCEAISCQRWSVPEGSRCACPPGWYSKFCEIRTCRPGIQQNLDISRRSIIVVFNTKTSMQRVWDAFKSNIGATIDKLSQDQDEGNWIANYIFYGFVAKNGKVTNYAQVLNTKDTFLKYLNSVQLSDGDDEQPVIQAIKDAQQTFPEMRPFAIVLVFTDSLASDAATPSFSLAAQTVEMNVYHIAMIWRNKISFFISPSVIDSSGDKFDVYRRLAAATHGDLFLVDSDQVSKVLINVVSTFKTPENLALGYDVSDDVQVQPTRDLDNDDVFVLLTVDTTSGSNKLPVLLGETPISQGDSYSFYSTKSSWVNISANAASVYTYRMFIQSWNTLLFTETNEDLVDVGNVLEPITMDHPGTSMPIGFTGFRNLSYAVTTTANKAVIGEIYGSRRPQQDCGFPFVYQFWYKDMNNLCPAGPITQIHRIYFDNAVKIRLIPSFCVDASAPTSVELPKPIVRETPSRALRKSKNMSANVCSSLNLAAVGDSRQSEFRQIIFVLERSEIGRATYENLAIRMPELVNQTIQGKPYNRQYSLITFDDQGVDVLLSSYHYKQFPSDFKVAMQTMIYKSKVDNGRAIEAIYKAHKIALLPPAIIYLFVSHGSTTVQNYTGRHWDTVPRDVQVNVVTLSETTEANVFDSPPQLQLVQRQTGGRLLHLTSSGKSDLVSLIAPTLYTTALSLDFSSAVCPQGNDFVVEKGASTVVIEFVGTGIAADGVVRLFDPLREVVDVKNATTFADMDVLVVTLDNPMSGHWGVQFNTKGGCGVQVRHVSPYSVIPGFVSKPDHDFASTQIFSQRRQEAGSPTFVIVRVSRNGQEEDIPLTSSSIETVALGAFSTPQEAARLTFSPRDDVSCAYQYVSSPVQIPATPLTKITVVALSTDELQTTLLQRVFYYYQQLPADPSICNGGAVGDSGECACPKGYTGEFCFTPVCAQGATESYGMCNCPLGHFGEFCELLIPSIQLDASTMSPTSLSTPLVPTTTRSGLRPSNFLPILVVMLSTLSGMMWK